MKIIKPIILFGTTILYSTVSMAQSIVDSLQRKIYTDSMEYANHRLQDIYDRKDNQLIPDKVFEIGLPVALILILMYVVLTVIKINADKQLRLKMIERDLSEEMMKQFLSASKFDAVFGSLKWALVMTGMGIGFILVEHLPKGFMTLGIITICSAVGFFIYYRIISKRR